MTEYSERKRQKIDLPTRAFLYTLDQLATLLAVPQATLEQKYLFFEGVDYGRRLKTVMVARNIAPKGSPPSWRVSEEELIRWAKAAGFAFYSRRLIG